MGGARLQNYGSLRVKSACAAEIFIEMGLKSTILELQRSFNYKRSCTINFQKNEARKNALTSSDGGGADAPPPTPGHEKRYDNNNNNDDDVLSLCVHPAFQFAPHHPSLMYSCLPRESNIVPDEILLFEAT